MTALPLRDFTAAEQARLDAIEAAPAAPESLRERVARALFEAQHDPGCNCGGWETTKDAEAHPYFRNQADAAIAVLSGPSSDADAAVERVLALADRHEECCGVVNIASLREAVRGES
jgi:hypothetical protein